MKRGYGAMMLMFVVLLIGGMGCRRVGEPQPSVPPVNEKEDIISGFSYDALVLKIKAKKKEVVPPGMMTFSEKYLLPETTIEWPPVEGDAAQKAQEASKKALEDARADFLKKRDERELLEVGTAVFAFIKKTPPPQRSTDGVKKELRRANKNALRDLIERKAIIVSAEADADTANQLLAYREEGSNDLNAAAVVAPGGAVLAYRKKEELEGMAKNQQLLWVWRAYDAFTKQAGAKSRDLESFKQFAKANTVGSASELIQGGAVLIADFAGATPWAACVAVEEPGKGHRAVSKTGQIGFLAPTAIAANFSRN